MTGRTPYYRNPAPEEPGCAYRYWPHISEPVPCGRPESAHGYASEIDDHRYVPPAAPSEPTPSQPVREAGDAEALGASWRELYTAHRRHLRDPRARDFGDGVLPYQWAVEAAIRAPLEAEVARLREALAEIREHLDYGGDVGHGAALHVVERALPGASQDGETDNG